MRFVLYLGADAAYRPMDAVENKKTINADSSAHGQTDYGLR